jgi:hypothetical protein
MRSILLILIVLFSGNLNAQIAGEYQFKCRKENKILKSSCETLSFDSDSSFYHYTDVYRGMTLVENGIYYENDDTIIMIYSDIEYVSSISSRKGLTNIFRLYFQNDSEYPVKVDSIVVFENGKHANQFTSVSKVEFSKGDSIHYYLNGTEYYAPLTYGNRTLKSIIIILPVEYLLVTDKSTIKNWRLNKVYKKTAPNNR